jgi:outer membrane protein OmpA-like peptidoglycan-associated protein/uncharacterized protein YegP (UPF0339 family)
MVNEDYLACSAYEGKPMHESEGNFTSFYDEASQQYFFALLDANGKVLLKSEGYPQPAARENGIQSVIKNRTNSAFYSVKQEDGAFYVSLRAANYREIARSCHVDSEAEAMALVAHASGEAAATITTTEVVETVTAAAIAETVVVEAAAPEVVVETIVAEAAPIAVDVEDDYLPCRDYHGHETSPRNGFRTFHSEKSNKYYFAVVDADGDVSLRSEGHLTAAERDEDMADVVQNIFKKERYNIKNVGLRHHFIVLRNASGKEIARSCAHDNLASVYEAASFLNPDRPVAKVETVAAAPVKLSVSESIKDAPLAKLVGTVSALESVKDAPLAKVVGTVSASVAGMSIAAAAPVIVETVQSIAVVPPPPPPPPVVEEVVETPPPPPADVEDDYLPCREYEGRPISDKANSVAMFKHDNGQFYFAIFNADETVRLRSEGFRTSQDRDKELSGALKNLQNPDMYTTVRRGDYYMSILKDKTGREVGRSCLQKDEPTPVVAPVVEPVVEAAPIAVAAVAAIAAVIPEIKMPEVEVPELKIPEVTVAPPVYVAPEIEEEVAETGFKWWWLLLPLLALLGWWMFGKGCNTAKAPAAVTVAPPTEAAPVAPAVVETPVASCDLNWILFEFDKADITADAKAELAQMSKILTENKEYVGVLSAHTDGRGSDAYNDALSLRRAAAAKRTLVAMGIAAERLKTQADGKGKPIAENTQDDAGRQFNRRVELYIQDKDGKNICQSIAPNIPDALKTK